MRKLVALVLALVLALCTVPAMAEGKLVIYTPNPDAEIQYILNPFIEVLPDSWTSYIVHRPPPTFCAIM